MANQHQRTRGAPDLRTDEIVEETLNPHRREEQLRAAEEASNRLLQRGIRLTGDEDPDELSDLQDAVERFETLVESRGGDLMVDDLRSSQPESPELVLPEREPGEPGEPVEDYIARIHAAAARLKAKR
jgi:broad specificity phosphatase PhoE